MKNWLFSTDFEISKNVIKNFCDLSKTFSGPMVKNED